MNDKNCDDLSDKLLNSIYDVQSRMTTHQITEFNNSELYSKLKGENRKNGSPVITNDDQQQINNHLEENYGKRVKQKELSQAIHKRRRILCQLIARRHIQWLQENHTKKFNQSKAKTEIIAAIERKTHDKSINSLSKELNTSESTLEADFKIIFKKGTIYNDYYRSMYEPHKK